MIVNGKYELWLTILRFMILEKGMRELLIKLSEKILSQSDTTLKQSTENETSIDSFP